MIMKQYYFKVEFQNGVKINYSCFAANYAEALQTAKDANIGYKEILPQL